MKYLCDTNILSEAVKPKPNAGVLRRLQDSERVLFTAAVVWLELWQGYHGLAPGRRKTCIGEYLEGLRRSNFLILPYTEACAERQADFSTTLARTGRVVPVLDAMIAATALANQLILVTRNDADFEFIPELQVENWFQED